MNLLQIAVPFFILLMLVEFLYGYWRKKQTYRLNDTVSSLQLGVISQLNNILKLGFSGIVFAAAVSWLGVETVTMDSIWAWIAAFVLYDLCYYWKHRYGHEWRILWASHVAHHQSEEYNLSTALRQTGTDYIGFFFYFPMYLAGFPVSAVVTVGSLNLIYQFWVHTQHINRLGPLEWAFVTPSNHRVHHARNPEYIDKNYGGVFILWDRMFGTFCDESPERPCVYGITKGLKSWNPIWANAHIWYETWLISKNTTRWRDKFLVWFKGPGWLPEDCKTDQVETAWDYPKFDPVVGAFDRWYTFVQFWVITVASLYIQQIFQGLSTSMVWASFIWLCYSLYVQAMWLEGRANARQLEWTRLGTLLLFAVAGPLVWPEITPMASMIAVGYAVLSGLVVLVLGRSAPAEKLAAAG